VNKSESKTNQVALISEKMTRQTIYKFYVLIFDFDKREFCTL